MRASTELTSLDPSPREWTLREYYETPDAFIDYLGAWLRAVGAPVSPELVYASPAHGAGRIRDRLLLTADPRERPRWVTNDLDPEWAADFHGDLRARETWQAMLDSTAPPAGPGALDYIIDNPPFTCALECAQLGLEYATTLLALHVRISFNEVTKDDPRGAWLREHPPTEILFLPRFAFRRSPRSREWSTDNVATCWMLWWKDGTPSGPRPQGIHYCPERFVKQLTKETYAYRTRIDQLTGYVPGA